MVAGFLTEASYVRSYEYGRGWTFPGGARLWKLGLAGKGVKPAIPDQSFGSKIPGMG